MLMARRREIIAATTVSGRARTHGWVIALPSWDEQRKGRPKQRARCPRLALRPRGEGGAVDNQRRPRPEGSEGARIDTLGKGGSAARPMMASLVDNRHKRMV